MYLSLNWLKDYIKIPASVSPEDLGLKLTMHTVEIDDVIKEASRYDKITVGKIMEVKTHPNADKLQVAEVDVGVQKLNIVCGATNIKAGQFVPVAMAGADLPGGLKIKNVEIRGINSEGMLCAEDELGLGEDHEGIMILTGKTKTGQPFGEYLKLDDVIYEVDNKSITHRPDLWGHYGIARDMSAFLGVKYDKKIENLEIKDIKPETEADLKIRVENFGFCPRYMAVALGNIRVGPSPRWIEKRLVSAGVRPINNIVDVTNYVMLELGQPLHAFDKKNIEKILVRNAREGESIITLDGEERELGTNNLLITDGEKPIAIAGVMGGSDTEINDTTNEIILESANFDPVSIRKTSQTLGLRTDASQRFEKSLDPNLCETALIRAVLLIKEINPEALVISRVKDEKNFTLSDKPIKFESDWLDKYLGAKIAPEKIIKIMTALGFAVLKKDSVFEVKVPTWRATKDISIKEDLAEEIARIIGYDNLTPQMPMVKMRSSKHLPERALAKRLRGILSGSAGLAEIYSYSFVGNIQLQKLGINTKNHLELVNPISANHTLLRQSMAPNMLEAVKINQSRRENIKLFELGQVFSRLGGSINKQDNNNDKLPFQERRLGIAIAGGKREECLSRLKGIIELLFGFWGLETAYSPLEIFPGWADSAAAAKVEVSGAIPGFVYLVDRNKARQFGLKKETAIAEFSVRDILDITGNITGKYREREKFPPVVRDLAFVVDTKVMYNSIREEILAFHKYIKKAELFDVYSGGKLSNNKKNLAFHIMYQADRTLTSKEIDDLQGALFERISEKFKAKLRDF